MERSFQIDSDVTMDSVAGDKFVVRWNPDDSHIAAACSDGTVKIYSSSSGAFIRSLNCRQHADPVAVTSVRWRPGHGKNILLATSADGGVTHWHATTGKVLNITRLEENQVLSVDYSADGRLYAIGCMDSTVRVYDESTKSLVGELLPGRGEHIGHNNRIFSIKWLSEFSLVSGGWDNNVLVWDIRVKDVIRHLYGPRVYGDSVDASSGKLLTGSCHTQEQLQVWNASDCSNIYSRDLIEEGLSCMVYTAQFSKADNGQFIAIGGGGNNKAYFFESESGNLISEHSVSQKAVYSVDFANHSNRVAIASGDGTVKIVEIN